MSKAFAFAGVRLGYLVANPKVIDALMLVRLPYHLSSLTQCAAVVALDSSDQLLDQVSLLVSSRNKLSSELKALGLTVMPSEANFILFTGFASKPSMLWQGLVERGVLIRDVGLAGYLRVTVGTESENRRFISELKLLMNGDTK
jgi:histidinol-phosphate aminotransferase